MPSFPSIHQTPRAPAFPRGHPQQPSQPSTSKLRRRHHITGGGSQTARKAKPHSTSLKSVDTKNAVSFNVDNSKAHTARSHRERRRKNHQTGKQVLPRIGASLTSSQKRTKGKSTSKTASLLDIYSHEYDRWLEKITQMAEHIFQAKCLDISQTPTAPRSHRFANIIIEAAREGKLSLTDMSLGENACQAICEVLEERERAAMRLRRQSRVTQMKLLKAKEKVEKRLSVFTAPNINGNGSNKNSRAESSNGGSINNNASRTDKEEKDAASPALERQLKAINTSIEKYAIKWQNTQRMSNFKMMNIQGNRIGDEGAKCIGQMLARNKSITSMNLSTNNINEDGFQAIFDALVNNPTLKTLNMSSTNLKGNMYLGHLGSSALKRLMKNNAVVRTLILQNCGVGLLLDAVRDVAHGIVLNKGLVNLDFGSNNLGYNEIAILAQALAQNKHIQVLSLRNNRFGTAGATLLSEVMRVDTGIRRLDLARCGIGLSGFALLTDALARNTNITKLVLDGNHFGSKAQVFLLEGGLGLGGDSNETQQFLQRMLQHYKLTSQWVSPNFSNAPGLTHLNLNSCSINDEFLAALCKVLKTNKVLHTLNINSNHIRDDGAFAVGELLAVNGALKTLDISFNSIQEEGGLAIAAGLKQNNTLTNLNLQDNEVGIDTANRMYECLTFKTHLIRCDVSGNKVPYSIFKKIADLASRYKRQYDINFNDRQYQLIKKLKQQNNALQKNGTPEMMRLQEERVEKELEDLIGSTADWNREQEKVTEDLLRKMKDLQLETIDYLDKYAKIADRKNEPSEEHLKLVSQLEGQISAEKRLKNSKITQMKQLEEELKIKTQELKSEDVLGDRMRNLLKNHTKKAQSERDELKERFTRVEQFIAQLQAELPPEEEKKDEEGDDDANDTSAVNGKNSDRRRGRKMSTGSTSTTTTSSSTSQQSKRRDARTRKSSVKPKGVNPRKSLARLSKTTTTPYQ